MHLLHIDDKEIKTFKPKKEILPGVYEFVITKAQESISKSGNSMIVLELELYQHQTPLHTTIKDYLVNTPKAFYRIKNFCESVGLKAQYERKELTEKDCIGKKGQIEVALEQQGALKSTGEEYPPTPRVKFYFPIEEKSMASNSVTSIDPFAVYEKIEF